MRIKKVILENFRGYKNRFEINLDDLTVLVGANDVGKSTILEAIDIFINDSKGVVKFDKGDHSYDGGENSMIGVVFDEFPQEIDIDGGYPTTLRDEYLLNSEGFLEVYKYFRKGKLDAIKLIADHPNESDHKFLIHKKRKELQKIVTENSIYCENKNINAELRKSIRSHYDFAIEENMNKMRNIVDKESGRHHPPQKG